MKMKNMKKGFTLIELMAVIAIMAVLVIVVLPNVIGIFTDSLDKAMHTQEATALDAAKLYIQDYCTHPINQTYRDHCNDNFRTLDTENKYLCVNMLQDKDYFDTILYRDVPCNGIIVLKINEKGVYDTGQTYLYCGSSGNYVYETEGGNSYESYLSNCK